jgi:3-deoxy-7-phosphoheptulonate synthase
MIVVMKPGAAAEDIKHVVDLVHEFGLKEHVIYGTDRTVIACIGDKRTVEKDAIENAPMVEKVVPILSPYKMASLEVKREKTKIAIGPEAFPLGGVKIGVIAGPCAVESREQVMQTALAIKAAGGIGLRGGAFKPRTSPYTFQGMGKAGLELLAEAREATGLAVVTEVIGLEQIEVCAKYADVLQIGARNMQHYPLLEAVGKVDKPVMLKRGMSATLDEFLLAAEYIINAGNPNVILCERGYGHLRPMCGIRCRWRSFRRCASERICRSSSIRRTGRDCAHGAVDVAGGDCGGGGRGDPGVPSRP